MVQVTTTAFSTPCLPRHSDPFGALRLCCALLLAFALVCLLPGAQAQTAIGASTELPLEPAADPVVPVDGLLLRPAGDKLQLSAALNFELPSLVEDALYKGIPVHFVQEVRMVNERWYWSDKVVAEVQRHMRLSYQPLTRRWRLYTGASPLSERGQGGVSLGVTFDTLDDAMSALRRITRWNVADLSQLPSSGEMQLELQMRIDTAQLPRPLQIGNLGRSGWSMLISRSKRVDAHEWR